MQTDSTDGSREGDITEKYSVDRVSTDDDPPDDAAEYECPRTVQDDEGGTEPCGTRCVVTKDYGEALYRACPGCGEDVTMLRVGVDTTITGDD